MGQNVCYVESWDLQKQLQQKLIEGTGPEHILFCEHSPTLTYGSSAKLEEVLLCTPESLRKQNIELVKTDRGGNITYHGPGQLVCYLIMNLTLRKPDVDHYLRSIEAVLIKSLSQLAVKATCIPNKTGIWTSESQKICSIGVRFSRWCSMHGFSLNLSSECYQGFSLINACGMNNITATSIQECTGLAPDRQQVIDLLTENILQYFYADSVMNTGCQQTLKK